MADIVDQTPAGALSFADLRAVLKVTLRAGQLLLMHGADAHRVEETIQRMGLALGVASMDIYVTPTGIIASASNGWEQRTIIQRVEAGPVDLSRIDAINQLSRRITEETLALETIATELERIAGRPRRYGRWITIIAVAIACGAFALLFGGGWREILTGICASALLLLVRQELMKWNVGPLLQITPSAFAGALCALSLAQILDSQRLDIAVPAAVLPLVPGIPLINSLSDLLANDFVSGVMRVAQAMLIAAEIAIGIALALDVARWSGWVL